MAYTNCCRLCLSELPTLSQLKIDCSKIPELCKNIEFVLGIKISPTDEFTYVCKKCFDKVISFNTFKKCSGENQNLLAEYEVIKNKIRETTAAEDIRIKEEPIDIEEASVDNSCFNNSNTTTEQQQEVSVDVSVEDNVGSSTETVADSGVVSPTEYSESEQDALSQTAPEHITVEKTPASLAVKRISKRRQSMRCVDKIVYYPPKRKYPSIRKKLNKDEDGTKKLEIKMEIPPSTSSTPTIVPQPAGMTIIPISNLSTKTEHGRVVTMKIMRSENNGTYVKYLEGADRLPIKFEHIDARQLLEMRKVLCKPEIYQSLIFTLRKWPPEDKFANELLQVMNKTDAFWVG